jgi:predicted transcriptional regulator of viral defense system
MMKLQDVLLKAMAKKITWREAAEIIGVTDRTMRRWRKRLEAEGYWELVARPGHMFIAATTANDSPARHTFCIWP